MDDQQSASILRITDEDLCSAVLSARTRIFLMAPGVSEKLANVVCERWRALGGDSVELVLDVDPEVCRLGYGDIQGLTTLQKAASELGRPLRHQPGIRIGLLIADGDVTFFAPTPLLIEAGSTNHDHPNAVRLGFVPIPLAQQVGLGGRKSQSTVGRSEVAPGEVERVSESLQSNPPLKFDVARTMRVFNSQIEFVEFELKGGALKRKTISLPSHLLSFVKDQSTRERLHSTFKLLSDGQTSINWDAPLYWKNKISSSFLIPLKGYGTVILREKKNRFERAVRIYRRFLERFQKRASKVLQGAIAASRQDLCRELVPLLTSNPPEQWRKKLPVKPAPQDIAHFLEQDLASLFGSAEDLLQDIEVKVLFKGVTYETLSDPEFLKLATKVLPPSVVLIEEASVARAQDFKAPTGQ